ncbi:MAG: MarR family transcriptional regulator [Coriobacteriia bacterium]|nr:MarR family transcriptional regulator [Coriobacteriia bacterium]
MPQRSPRPADRPGAIFGQATTPGRGHHDPGDLAHAMRRAWYLVIRGLDQGPRLFGLQTHQFWVLGSLQHGPRRMSELATITDTTQANITGMVARLEDRGLVRRYHSERDRRVVEVELTDEGKAALAESRLAYAARMDVVMADLSEEERQLLTDLLRRAVHPGE